MEKKTIYMIDDDRGIYDQARPILENAGYKVDTWDYSTGLEGIRKTLAAKKYDAIISDFELGAVGSFRDVSQIIGEAGAKTPVVLMSSVSLSQLAEFKGQIQTSLGKNPRNMKDLPSFVSRAIAISSRMQSEGRTGTIP